MSSTIIRKSFSDLPNLIGLQIWSRIVTFILNIFVIRAVDGAIFGAFSVELLLVLQVSMFVTREALRSVVGRAGSSSDDLRKVFWLSFLIAVPFGALVCAVVHFVASLAAFDSAATTTTTTSTNSVVWLISPLTVTSLAAFLELCGEPFYAALQSRLLLGARVRVNGLGTLTRCVAVYVLAIHFDWGLMAFAAAEVVKSLTDSLGYVVVAYSNGLLNEIFVVNNSNNSNNVVGVGLRVAFDELRRQSALLSMFYWQSLQKLVLTEAEKIALWFGASLFSQGTYSIVGNLGSLIARLWFQPFEEITRLVFQKLSTQLANEATVTLNNNSNNKKQQQQQASDESQKTLQSMATVLLLLVKTMLLVSLFAVCFGPSYSHALLRILYGESIASTAAPVLAFYCVYILFMAVNGVTEGFVHSTASHDQLRRLNVALLALSLSYIVAAALLLRYFGTIGLVIANCLNLLLRILYSLDFMANYFKSNLTYNVRQALPNNYVSVTFLITFIITFLSSMRYSYGATIIEMIPHILLGVFALFSTVFMVFTFEKEFLRDLRSLLKQRRE